MKLQCTLAFLLLAGGFAAGQEAAAQAGPAVTNAIQLRVAGSSVVDGYSIFCGNIESVVIDPLSHQALFAMVSPSYPSNRFTVTPIPWPLLRHHADARASVGVPGTFQQFKVALDRTTILRAPRVQLNERTNDFTWMAASRQYFGVHGGHAPPEASGAPAGGASSSPPPAPAAPAPAEPSPPPSQPLQ